MNFQSQLFVPKLVETEQINKLFYFIYHLQFNCKWTAPSTEEDHVMHLKVSVSCG